MRLLISAWEIPSLYSLMLSGLFHPYVSEIIELNERGITEVLKSSLLGRTHAHLRVPY
jgi:hypothetical protein